MIKMDMENKKRALNDEQADMVRGGWSLLDVIGDGIGYLYDKITEKIDDLYDGPRDGCTGEQEVPGFNVY